MKKALLFSFLLMFVSVAFAQETDEDETVRRKPVVLPGAGHLNVENLNKFQNFNLDISKLSLSELRVLRNSFPARQGYIFSSGDLRSIFMTTSWYESLMYKRFETDEATEGYGYQDDGGYKTRPLKYTAAEQKFMAKLKAREDELMKKNFEAPHGMRVNTANLLNPWQLETIDPKLMEMLGRNGFAIVPNSYEQLFHIYEHNDYSTFPSFVTTDLYLQLFHMYFDCLLREVEEKKLSVTIENFCLSMYQEMRRMTEQGTMKSAEMKDAAEYDAAFFAVGYTLMTGKPLMELSAKYAAMAKMELSNVNDAENNYSEFLDYKNVKFGYSLFRPRGHYTRTDVLKRYFQAMMWLQTVPFGTDKPEQMHRAMLMASIIGNSAQLKYIYNKVFEPIGYLMGSPDNITILQLNDEMNRLGGSAEAIAKDKKKYNQLVTAVEALGEKQTRIRPKFERTSHCKINLMPQRYQPDAEVLQEMVDYETFPVTKRDVPRGLDFFAALGNGAAERILLNELNEATRWEKYKPNLQRMKQRMSEIDWEESVSTKWMSSLATLVNTTNAQYPYFMRTDQWKKKDLNAVLASWAELKHDAILYAKQPMGAECGAYEPPEPVFKGYVEPNVAYWQKALTLIDATVKVLRDYQLTTERTTEVTERLRDEAQFLLNVSKKELAGKKLTDQEYHQIQYIGATYENITLDLIRAEDQWLQGWVDVQGADKNIAVVADVYTANADNNPAENQSILYEGVGPASEIYVIVEIDGQLWLTRGAVFSYREFKRASSDPRLTDEEWQQSLQEKPFEGVPSWMNEIVVPMKNAPVDNESVFYSTGC